MIFVSCSSQHSAEQSWPTHARNMGLASSAIEICTLQFERTRFQGVAHPRLDLTDNTNSVHAPPRQVANKLSRLPVLNVQPHVANEQASRNMHSQGHVDFGILKTHREQIIHLVSRNTHEFTLFKDLITTQVSIKHRTSSGIAWIVLHQ